MGGRGSGSSILDTFAKGQGIIEGGSNKWRTVVADFNPNAGHKEVVMSQTHHDFAAIAKKLGKDECEYLGAIDEDGYTEKVQGDAGRTNQVRAYVLLGRIP